MDVKITLKELAARLEGRAEGNGGAILTGVAGIEDASVSDVTFVANPKYAKLLGSTRAGCVLVAEGVNAPGKNLIVVKDPYLAFARTLEILRPPEKKEAGVHSTAVIHGSAKIGEGAHVGAHVVVEKGAVIGNRTVIYPGVYVGAGSSVGDDCIIYSNVSLRERSKVGARVIIHCNTVIGSDGFGYAKGPKGLFKVPQTGNVEIGDDVEIGACVTIDRGTIGSTKIGRGTKIDNLVQIAHNVSVGENTVLVAQVGISGSTAVGSRVTIAGQTGVAGHLEVADDVTIGAKSGVTNDINKKGVYTGYPAIEHKDWLAAQGVFARLPELRKKILALEKRLEELEKKS